VVVGVAVDVSVGDDVSVAVDVSVAPGVSADASVAAAVAVAVAVRPPAASDSTTGVPPYPNPETSASDSFSVPSFESGSAVDPSRSFRSASSENWNQVPVPAAAVPVSATNVRRESFRSPSASLPHPIVCR